MQQYVDLVKKVLREGEIRHDRTGVGTKAIFGGMIEFDLTVRFPLVTVKETRWKVAFLEMLFFLRGESNTKWLHENGSKLWDEWADGNGNLGPVYGFGWRNWGAKPTCVPQPAARLREGLKATYLGIANGAGKANHPLGKTWEGLIARCYDRKSVSYPLYGAKGVHVCNRWLEFSAFAEDAKNLPGYENLFQEPAKALDKDTLGDGFTYSPETCCWITYAENAAAKAEWLYTVEKGSQQFTFTNSSEFCREHNVEGKNFSDLWTGAKNAKQRGGFKLVSRTPLIKSVDQVAELIEGLKKQPTGRRHIVSAWNVGELSKMALMPCHWAFQCYVTNDMELDMVVHQRSWDLALGAPFNIAGYALLLTLLGRATGYKPRKLKFSYGDAHIYTNHLQAMEEVVSRRFYFCDTQLKIETENMDIDGYKLSDFSIENYEHGPFVKLPVAV